MQIHHVGYIVDNAEDTSVIQETLHKVASVFDPLQEAKIVLYKNEQDELIEFIQPLNEKSPVWNFLQKNGSGFHHHCYQANAAEIENFCSKNHYTKIMGPVPAKIFHSKPVEFYTNKERKIIEFILE